jgi:hypothetical protein
MDPAPAIIHTVIVKNREMTGRTRTLPSWLKGEGIKTTETKKTLASLDGGEGPGEGGGGGSVDRLALGTIKKLTKFLLLYYFLNKKKCSKFARSSRSSFC